MFQVRACLAAQQYQILMLNFPPRIQKKKTIKSKKETVTKHNETGDMACMMVVRVNMKNNQIQIYSLDF